MKINDKGKLDDVSVDDVLKLISIAKMLQKVNSDMTMKKTLEIIFAHIDKEI